MFTANGDKCRKVLNNSSHKMASKETKINTLLRAKERFTKSALAPKLVDFGSKPPQQGCESATRPEAGFPNTTR